MVISDNGASAEGGPTGTTNEAQFFNNAQEPLEESLKLIDEIGGPKHFNHYPWGWTWAGNTPFRRWKRETYRGGATDPFIVSWPKGIKAQGRGPHAVRAHHRHGADRARPARRPAAGADPRRDASRRCTASASRTPSTIPARAAAATPSTSRCSDTARSTTTAGGRSVRGRGRRSPKPGCRSASRSRSDTLSKLDATGWELYHVDEDFAETRNVAADNRDRLIAMIGTWYVEAGKYDVMPIDGSGLAADGRREAADRAAARQLHLLCRTRSRSRTSRRLRCSTARTASPRRRDPAGGSRGRAAQPGHRRGRVLLLRQGRQAALRAQLRRPPAPRRRIRRRRPGRKARAPLRVRADRRAGHAARQGRARQAAALHRRRPGRQRRRPGHDAVHVQPRCAHLRRQPRLAGHTRLRTARSRSPARSTASPSTSAAS